MSEEKNASTQTTINTGIHAGRDVNVKKGNVNIFQGGTQYFTKCQHEEVEDSLISIAKQCYREEMEKHTAVVHHIDSATLRGHHKVAAAVATRRVSGTMQLKKEIPRRIDTVLNDMFQRIELINVKKQTAGKAIGIDFGTTLCCVAVCREPNKPEIIPNDNDNYKTPSYVAFLEISNNESDTEVECGETAKQQASSNPKGTIFDVKRMLGQPFSSNLIQQCIKYWPFDVITGNDQILITPGRNTKQSFTPVQITAYLLRHLVKLAEEFLESPVVNAVIAVPVKFSAYQEMLIRDACELAHLNLLQVVHEPTAASIAYHNVRDDNVSRLSNHCIIVDFGGGTFDVAVLKIEQNGVYILKVGGDNNLGGNLIDQNIAEYCQAQFEENRGVDLKKQLTARDLQTSETVSKYLRQLLVKCEDHKKVLSMRSRTLIYMDEILGAHSLSIPMTKELFYSINADIFTKCISIINNVLQQCELDKLVIAEIVLVGGSSRIPVFRQMITDFFQKEPMLRSVRVDEAVAAGAAILASEAFDLSVPSVLGHNVNSQSKNNQKKPDVPPRPNQFDASSSSVKEKAKIFDGVSQNSAPMQYPSDNVQSKTQHSIVSLNTAETKAGPLPELLEKMKLQSGTSSSLTTKKGWELDKIITEAIALYQQEITVHVDKLKQTMDDIKRTNKPADLSLQSLFRENETKHSSLLQNQHKIVVSSLMSKFSQEHALELDHRRRLLSALDWQLQNYLDKLKLLTNSYIRPVIGIDFGLTFCRAAVYHNGIVNSVQNDLGAYSTPSAVAIEDEERAFVGEAVNNTPTDEWTAIFNVRRLINIKWPHYIVSENIAPRRLQVLGVHQSPEIIIGGITYPPELMCSKLFNKLKYDANVGLDTPAVDVVITVPSYFNNAQRKATKDAAVIAGLNVLEIMNEPTAAVISYGLDRVEQSKRNVLVFDLGVETFDVTVLTIENGNIEITATGGDQKLGGEDFTSAMVDFCIQHFNTKTGCDLTNDLNYSKKGEKLKTIGRIRNVCEVRKSGLFNSKAVRILVECVHKSEDLQVSLKRKTFELMIEDKLSKCIKIVDQTIQDIDGIQKQDISDIILIGESCRIPKLREKLNDYFGKNNLIRSIDYIAYAHECRVAIGAAIRACRLSEGQERHENELSLTSSEGTSLDW